MSKHIYTHVLSSKSGILRGKTRILVTNALYMLPEVDSVVFLKDGQIEAMGPYQYLQETNVEFAEMMANYFNTTADHEPEQVPVGENLVETEETSESGHLSGLVSQSIRKLTTQVGYLSRMRSWKFWCIFLSESDI